MLLYRTLRWLARVALDWFYGEIEFVGVDRIPRHGPVLLAVNHPNALIDALLAGLAALGDDEERRQQALRINERHAELVPFIPLTQFLQLNAVSRRLRNYDPHFLPWVYEVHSDLWVSA